jgi:hypothetical protein
MMIFDIQTSGSARTRETQACGLLFFCALGQHSFVTMLTLLDRDGVRQEEVTQGDERHETVFSGIGIKSCFSALAFYFNFVEFAFCNASILTTNSRNDG